MKQGTEKRVIFFLFFASGISGLIYEVVWLRILSRVIGVTTYATAITLAAFMSGLALGSLIFGKFIDKRRDQLRIYGLLQLSVAIVAVITPALLKISIPLYKYVYEITGQSAGLIAATRAIVSFICLLVPTTLMGGTLPVLTSYMVRKGGLFGKSFSLLYGLNTLGAVFGVILSGFITIGIFGEWNTTFIAVIINFTIGSAAFLLYKKASAVSKEAEVIEDKFTEPSEVPISPYPDAVRRIVLISILISGFTALAYEVIWTRQLILFLKTSIYAFSAMLAVFLTGIGVGSICVNKFVDRLKRPVVVFGVLELIVGVLSIFNLHLFSPLDSSQASRILAPVILVFPLTFLFGAIFPIACLCYAKTTHRSGCSVGILYGFNTIGTVTGSLVTGFLFISLLGSTKTVILLGFVNVVLGLILLYSEPNKSSGFKTRFLVVIPVVVVLALGFKGKDPFLDTIERRISAVAHKYEVFYNRETVEGTVTSFITNGFKRIWINGVGQTGLVTETKLMAHLPIMLATEPQKILVICFGMGTTVRSACIYDDLDITAVELVPAVYECFKYYHSDAEEISSRDNLNLVAADGRNFLLLSSDKYDVITVDPSPPIYNAGTVNLYTREFISLCKEHLTPDGVMCLWVPEAGRGSTEDRLFILKTFYSVFPNITAWRAPSYVGFYIIGTLTETKIDKSKIEMTFTDPKFSKDVSEYNDSCVTSSQLLDLLFLRRKEDIEALTEDAMIITDNFPYTEFPLWRYLLDYRKRAGLKADPK